MLVSTYLYASGSLIVDNLNWLDHCLTKVLEFELEVCLYNVGINHLES